MSITICSFFFLIDGSVTCRNADSVESSKLLHIHTKLLWQPLYLDFFQVFSKMYNWITVGYSFKRSSRTPVLFKKGMLLQNSVSSKRVLV